MNALADLKKETGKIINRLTNEIYVMAGKNLTLISKTAGSNSF
jgi:hypothetical protein